MGTKRRSLPARYGSDVDLRKRAPPTETHFCVGAFERAAQFQLTRGGSGLDISAVSPCQSERLPSSVLDLTGAAACGESLSAPDAPYLLQGSTTSGAGIAAPHTNGEGKRA